MEKLPFMAPDAKANLRLEDVPRFNSMHLGHIQRLYSEQVRGPYERAHVHARKCVSARRQLWPHAHSHVFLCASSCAHGKKLHAPMAVPCLGSSHSDVLHLVCARGAPCRALCLWTRRARSRPQT